MTWWNNKVSSPSIADRTLAIVLTTLAALTAVIVLFIGIFVAREAMPALRTIGLWAFLTDGHWHPTAGGNAQFGIRAMLMASLLITVGSMAIAGPIGLLAALFECYYAPRWFAAGFRTTVELLNGVPSVVFGYWGLVVLVPLLNQWHPPGQSLLAGMLILAMMIVPTVILTASAALRTVPEQYTRSAMALGIGRGAIIWHLALPTARRGIGAGLVLGTARAVGETMAVLMVCGNVVQMPRSLFSPVRTITANIALEMGYATASHRAALFVTGLMLMLMVTGGILLMQLLGRGDSHA